MDQFYLRNTTIYHTLVEKIQSQNQDRSQSTDVSREIIDRPSLTVCARIRPLPDEDIAIGFPYALYPRPRQSKREDVVDVHDLYNHPRGRPVLKSSSYQMTRLFDDKVSSENIYDEAMEDLLSSAWNGDIGTLFAYGQTGSGKTFTIGQLGILAASSLMNRSSSNERSFYITATELAGNNASDLLNSRTPISILEDASGIFQLAGSTERLVKDKDDMIETLQLAAASRQTARTTKNDASSRSHSIVRVRIEDKSANRNGFLYLVDLAGSEAARDVATHGAERMRETKEINMSLSVLKDCLRCKAEADVSRNSKKTKAAIHVPYRRSALTKVLKHLFEPDNGQVCKTLVMACVSPSLADVASTKNTLRYAQMLHLSTSPGATKLDERVQISR